MRIRTRIAAVAVAAAAVLAGGLAAAPAQALDAPSTSVSPPGANDFSCRPTKAHPYPVVLVPGTFESMAKNWSTLSPRLKSAGYCVFALDYGSYNGVPASGPIAESAKELRTFVDRVIAATGVRTVDLVGHSQGGMMPRQYLKFLGGASKVHALIGLAPSNHGTKGLIVAAPDGSPTLVPSDASAPACPACTDQMAGSPFLTRLNRGGDVLPGIFYTVISTRNDEVVVPYTSQALAGPKQQVTNVVLQDLCPADQIEHDQMPNDPVAQQLVLKALAHESGPLPKGYRPSCV